MTLNGCLAGLVAITAPCAFVTVPRFRAHRPDRRRAGRARRVLLRPHQVDDPVGATSVHLLNGVFGTICVGLFATPDRHRPRRQPGCQGRPVLRRRHASACHPTDRRRGLCCLRAGDRCVAWLVLKYTVGIRVSPDEEREGLDIGEHGNEAYPGFVKASSPTL